MAARVLRGATRPLEDDRPAPRKGLQAGYQPTRRLETKQEAFVRLAMSRMPFVDEALANFRKLANPEIYEHTASQVDAIETHLRAEVDRTIEAFRSGGKTSTFKLEVVDTE